MCRSKKRKKRKEKKIKEKKRKEKRREEEEKRKEKRREEKRREEKRKEEKDEKKRKQSVSFGTRKGKLYCPSLFSSNRKPSNVFCSQGISMQLVDSTDSNRMEPTASR